MPKRHTTIRLPELTDRQLAELSRLTGLNTSELLTTAIDRMYQQEIGTHENPNNEHVRRNE
jgi:post-segregation antitoxin (ccd killing protein)